jgi:hypothetical protein
LKKLRAADSLRWIELRASPRSSRSASHPRSVRAVTAAGSSIPRA